MASWLAGAAEEEGAPTTATTIGVVDAAGDVQGPQTKLIPGLGCRVKISNDSESDVMMEQRRNLKE